MYTILKIVLNNITDTIPLWEYAQILKVDAEGDRGVMYVQTDLTKPLKNRRFVHHFLNDDNIEENEVCIGSYRLEHEDRVWFVYEKLI